MDRHGYKAMTVSSSTAFQKNFHRNVSRIVRPNYHDNCIVSVIGYLVWHSPYVETVFHKWSWYCNIPQVHSYFRSSYRF